MTTMLEVMTGRLGIQEIPGKKNNPVIVGWAAKAGHPEIVDDETSWCSICMSSAAVEAELPCPPVNINTMAKSWLTWGVGVELEDVQPGDVAVWPRGDPRGPYGHVNIVEEVVDHQRWVVCIGGNQGGLKGGDAVTRAKPRKKSEALGFRRAVPVTIKALREAGSTEVRKGDQLQNAGTAGGIVSAAIAAVNTMTGPVAVPKFADVKESLSWWQEIMGGVNAVGELISAHPWIAGTLIVGALCFLIGHQLKAARLAKHAAGVPLSSQIPALGSA